MAAESAAKAARDAYEAARDVYEASNPFGWQQIRGISMRTMDAANKVAQFCSRFSKQKDIKINKEGTIVYFSFPFSEKMNIEMHIDVLTKDFHVTKGENYTHTMKIEKTIGMVSDHLMWEFHSYDAKIHIHRENWTRSSLLKYYTPILY